MFLYRLPCLPSANKTGLGHMLTRDQSFPGHGYGFYPSESRTIYIYIALQQHDVQMIQHWPTHRFTEVWALHHYVQPAHREPHNYTLVVYDYNSLLVWLNPEWS